MEMQPIRVHRHSKTDRKISFNSQVKASNAKENRVSRMLQSSRTNHSSQFEPVFNSKATMLEPIYCDSIVNISSNPIMHIGVCLPFDNLAIFLKQLFNDSITKALTNLNKLRFNQQSTGNIYFLPFWYYKVQNCSIVLWLLPAQHLKQSEKRRVYDIFLSYPQIIFMQSQTYLHFARKGLNLTKILNFQQQIALLDSRQTSIIKSATRKQSQNHKFHFVDSVNQYTLKSILLLTMKKNSSRCFRQCLKINFYILESLCYGNQSLHNEEYNLLEQNNLATILNQSASNYLTQQVQKKYDSLTQTFKNSPPKHQKQLQIELNQYQQSFLKEIKANFKILNSKQKQKQLCDASQKIISANNQQILLNNREMAKRQNNQIIIELYDKLLNNFEKGKYNTKDRQQLMAQDLQNMMQDYEKKAVKSGSLFFIFNSFMRHNKSRYYQKIQSLEDQNDYIRKTQNFDQIFDKIQIKKKVLYTLQKQVRHLQNKKNQVQVENEHLKALEKQLNQKRFQSDNQDFAQADSIKTIKTRPIPERSPRAQDSNMMSQQKKPKNKQILMKKKQKKGCLQCCNCTIF